MNKITVGNILGIKPEKKGWVNTEEPTKTWRGTVPVKCDVCRGKLDGVFVDGKTAMRGMWANMCEPCHKTIGVGLGLGKGQRYEFKE